MYNQYMAILDNFENFLEQEECSQTESAPIINTDNMGRQILWQD